MLDSVYQVGMELINTSMIPVIALIKGQTLHLRHQISVLLLSCRFAGFFLILELFHFLAIQDHFPKRIDFGHFGQ